MGSFLKCKEDNDNTKDSQKNIKDTKDYLKAIIPHLSLDLTNKYAIKAWEYFKAHKPSDTLTNNDLIYKAYLLLQNQDIKNKLAKKYDVIYIDEFQDTDTCQIELIKNLALAIEERKRIEGIKTSSLVIVGDPKQSIYKFRGADFDSFNLVREEFATFGQNFVNIFFPDNFRSNNFIVNYVNDTYSDKNKSFCEGYTYQNMEYKAKNEIPNNLNDHKYLAGVYSYPFNEDSYSDNKFISLAKFIRYLLDNDFYLYIGGSSRKIKESDFLIITKGHKEMSSYVNALSEYHIKAQVAGQFDLTTSRILRSVYRLLQYLLDDSSNSKTLATLISKDLSNCDIEQIKGKVRDFSSYGKLLYLLNHINLVAGPINETDLYVLEVTIHQIEEKLFALSSYDDVSLLEEFKKIYLEYAESELPLEEDEAALRIMNVHKSKGLEGEIIIIADSGGTRTDNFVSLKDASGQKKFYCKNLKVFPKMAEQNTKECKEEALRLEYVAASRSKQVLIFEKNIKGSGHLFNSGGEYDFSSEALEKYHLKTSSLPDNEEVNKYIDTLTLVKENRIVTRIDDLEMNDNLTKSSLNDITPSSLEIHPDIPIKGIKHLRPSDNIFGNCLHKAMEIYFKDREESVTNIVNISLKENRKDIKDSDFITYKKYLLDTVNSVIKLFSCYPKELYEAYPEFKFYDFDEKLYEKDKTLMHGSIDLLLINKKTNEMIIIDYKTDIAGFTNKEDFEKLLKNTYQNQIRTYRTLIKKILNPNNISTRIVWIEENKGQQIAHYLDID